MVALKYRICLYTPTTVTSHFTHSLSSRKLYNKVNRFASQTVQVFCKYGIAVLSVIYLGQNNKGLNQYGFLT